MTPRQRRQILAYAVLIGGTMVLPAKLLLCEAADVAAAVRTIAVITSGVVAPGGREILRGPLAPLTQATPLASLEGVSYIPHAEK